VHVDVGTGREGRQGLALRVHQLETANIVGFIDSPPHLDL
jgi:hypothetical protein